MFEDDLYKWFDGFITNLKDHGYVVTTYERFMTDKQKLLSALVPHSNKCAYGELEDENDGSLRDVR